MPHAGKAGPPRPGPPPGARALPAGNGFSVAGAEVRSIHLGLPPRGSGGMRERDVAKKPDPAAGTRSATESKRSTTARSTPDAASIYQLKVTLRDTDPAIWRRLLVPGEISFRDFHQVLQVAMGWENDHLYEFKVGKRYFRDRALRRRRAAARRPAGAPATR